MATAIPRPTRTLSSSSPHAPLASVPADRPHDTSNISPDTPTALSTPDYHAPERSPAHSMSSPSAIDDTPEGGVPLTLASTASAIPRPSGTLVITPGRWLSKSGVLGSPQSPLSQMEHAGSRRSSFTPRSSIRSPSYTAPSRVMSQSAAQSNEASSATASPSPQPMAETRTASAESSLPTTGSGNEDVVNDLPEVGTPLEESSLDDQGSATPSSTAQDKGNVIVSVRVRPEIGGLNYRSGSSEWWIDGEDATISYRGRESGEYSYGTSVSAV